MGLHPTQLARGWYNKEEQELGNWKLGNVEMGNEEVTSLARSRNYACAKFSLDCINIAAMGIKLITSLVAIYFSKIDNIICPVRVSNREIWHRHR